ncbi:hypothetical protein JJN56_04480 [Listeria monocytogenes]|uniref:hypothetical protein n=2 Tax=Listeria monocytogenes TaxID=1639 RepID=UPI0011EA5DC3|nr:hypothetical protein [Listeria monocytogenes]EJJ9960779.1 hypothetical protein [Listeria monocytogenes]MCE8321477.1 hypothetical protein [Listeria monocytogenes]NVR32640.1 hypothetical protein [Listeria monocytogenes]HAB7672117.1 hypothetical protein [Listeria monocytogenes]
MMYAIRHKRTKKFVYGTDKRYSKFRQRTSNEQALLFESYFIAHTAFNARQVSHMLYEIVPVELIVKESEGEA